MEPDIIIEINNNTVIGRKQTVEFQLKSLPSFYIKNNKKKYSTRKTSLRQN